MTIENPSIIDAIGTDKTTGAVHLSITDHLPWTGSAMHLLQEKINRYFGFIETGELIESFPNAPSHEVVIDVFCKYRPTDEAIAFFDKASAVASEYGTTLRYTHSGSGYADDSA